ncbi:hypothetical protein [Arthrobacter psychrolactophilus]
MAALADPHGDRRGRSRGSGPGRHHDRLFPYSSCTPCWCLAGVGTHGTQCLIIAAVATRYPSHLRGTALGWALGVGRIGAVAAPQAGGFLLAAGLGVNSNFLAFAGAAAIAAILLWVISVQVKTSPSSPSHSLTTVGSSHV